MKQKYKNHIQLEKLKLKLKNKKSCQNFDSRKLMNALGTGKISPTVSEKFSVESTLVKVRK